MNSLLVAFFVIGNVVGSGFFYMPSILAPLGMGMLFSWLISGVIAIVFALIFGRLYVIFPQHNLLGDYFSHHTIRRGISLLYWLSCIIGNTGLVMVIASCFNLPHLYTELFIIVLLTEMNLRFRAKFIEKFGVILTISKFVILIGMPIIFLFMKPYVFKVPPFSGNLKTICLVGISSFWSFLGIESAGVFGSGESARKGLIYGVLACCVLYVVTSIIILGCVPKDTLINAGMPFGSFASVFLGDAVKPYINFVIALTAFGALHGWVAATSKIALLGAKTGNFGKLFEKSTKSDVSFWGLIISSIISALIVLGVSNFEAYKQFSIVADLCVFWTFLIYFACALHLFLNADRKNDKIVAFLGMFLVLISLLADIKLSLIALGCYALVFGYCFLFPRKTY
jgi:APA family basic amino acid/polyamine antiporter